MRSTRTLSFLFALVLLAAACNPGTQRAEDEAAPATAGADGEAAEQPVDEATAESLRVTVWTGDEGHLAMLNGIAEDFAAQHDTVEEVEFETLPFENYNDALTVQLAGGNAPDLGWIFERNVPEFIAAGALANVGPQLRDDPDYDFDDVSAPALSLWTEGDAVYAYPFSTSPFGVFYNADMFVEAGLETPDVLLEDGEWTWEALVSSAQQIVEQGVAEDGFVVRDFNYELWEQLAQVWASWDAKPWSDDGATCQFDSPEMREALAFFHSAVFDKQAHPGPGEGADFFAGEAAMTLTQMSRAGLTEDGGYEWGVVPLPEGPAGAQQMVGQAGLAVFGASENQAAAVDFLKFMTNDENTRTMAQFFPPPRESLLNVEVLSESNPLLSDEQLEQVVIEGIATGETIPSHVNFAQIQETVGAQLDALWEPDADIEAGTTQVCEAMAPLLDS